MTKISAIIVAAGTGQRFENALPKQYHVLAGKTVLQRSLEIFINHPAIDEVIPIINPAHKTHYDAVLATIRSDKLKAAQFCDSTRGASVYTGLKAASGAHVLIHDAARPCLPLDALDRLIGALKETDGAFLALPVIDAIWQNADALTPISREALWRAQTPQAFATQTLIKAYDLAGFDKNDDVEVALAAGHRATPILGAEENFKITHPDDLRRARALLKSTMTPRIGIGYDVHAFEAGDCVILNGISIPFDKALKGHSDADVAMHAITDAIYGALADGDIGQHFPPSDPSWKGQESDLFLRHACQRAKDAGYKIANLDCTIICEQPKIGPHAQAMRENLAQICDLNMDQVSVKATTSEQLGFTGRGEGIAAQAIAQLISS